MTFARVGRVYFVSLLYIQSGSYAPVMWQRGQAVYIVFTPCYMAENTQCLTRLHRSQILTPVLCH